MGCFDQEETQVQKEPTAEQPVKQTKIVERVRGVFQLMGIEGQPIFTSDLKLNPNLLPQNRNRLIVEALPGILNKALIDIFPSEIMLEDLALAGIVLKGFDLRGITVTRTSFAEADLRSVDFRGANLYGCSFNSARLSGANFLDANLDETNFDGVEANMIHGMIQPIELDDYYVWGYSRLFEREGGDGRRELRIRAGCRDFDMDEALEHWETRSDRRQIFSHLNTMAIIAEGYGWATTRKEVTKRGKRAAAEG